MAGKCVGNESITEKTANFNWKFGMQDAGILWLHKFNDAQLVNEHGELV